MFLNTKSYDFLAASITQTTKNTSMYIRVYVEGIVVLHIVYTINKYVEENSVVPCYNPYNYNKIVILV